jgi:serine/threonine-protein kinase
MLAGRVPFSGTSATQVAARISSDDPPPLDEAVPRELAAAVERCLQKDPARRFSNVVELAAAIAPFASGEDATAIVERVQHARFSDAFAATVVAGGDAEPASKSAEKQGAPTGGGRKTEALSTPALEDPEPEAPRDGAEPSPGRTVEGTSASHRPEPMPPPPRSRATWALVALSIVVLGGGAFAWRRAQAPDAADPAPPKESTITSTASAPVVTAPSTTPPTTVTPPVPSSASKTAETRSAPTGTSLAPSIKTGANASPPSARSAPSAPSASPPAPSASHNPLEIDIK